MYLLCIYRKPIILSLFNIDTLNFTMYILTILTVWCKSGTRTTGAEILGPWDPQSLKVGPVTPLKFKSRTPSPFFNEFIFFRIFYIFKYQL